MARYVLVSPVKVFSQFLLPGATLDSLTDGKIVSVRSPGLSAFRIDGRAYYNPTVGAPRVVKGAGAASDLEIGRIAVDYAALPYHDVVGGGGNDSDALFACFRAGP